MIVTPRASWSGWIAMSQASIDDRRVLVRSDEADQDVGTLLADLARRRHRARDRLADDDHLDVGIGGEPDELAITVSDSVMKLSG